MKNVPVDFHTPHRYWKQDSVLVSIHWRHVNILTFYFLITSSPKIVKNFIKCSI